MNLTKIILLNTLIILLSLVNGTALQENLLCNETYKYIEIYGADTFAPLTSFLEQINEDYNTSYTYNQAKEYIDNWQGYCSDVIHRSLKEEYVCNKIFYFLSDNQGSYKSNDLMLLKDKITEISISAKLLTKYTENYAELCYPINNKKLPYSQKKGIPFLNFSNSNFQNCHPELNKTIIWDTYDLDFSFPLPEILLGSKSCSFINFFKWFLRLEKRENSIVLTGLKLWYVILGMLIFVLYIIKKELNINTRLNSLIRGKT